MNYEIINVLEAETKTLAKIDEFVFSNRTNGEFVNSIKYLSYHPRERFEDDSIAVIDRESGTIRGVMLAAKKKGSEKCIISHPGTTFAGPVVDYHIDIASSIEILNMMLQYYEEKYDAVEIRLRPTVYDAQPMEFLPYYLLSHGYNAGMMALANIIDIRSVKTEQDLLSLYTSKRRNHVRKAIKEALYCFNERDKVEEFIWNNMNENLKGKYQSETTHSFQEICQLRELFPTRIVPYTAERNDQKYGAFVLVYKFKKVFHTQYLDLNYKYSSEYPHLYLVHKLILKAREEGYDYFSFGSSTDERGKYLNEGLFHYKSGYGGGSIILPVYVREK